MLHLIPAPLHRWLYRLANAIRRRWLIITKQTVHGCSVIARDNQGRVLLVRHSYGPRVWSFPGGGMKQGEDALLAAMREFAEELGCSVTDAQHVGTLEERFHSARSVAHIFTGLIDGEPRPDMREIVAARFFSVDQLPGDVARNVKPRLALLVEAAPSHI